MTLAIGVDFDNTIVSYDALMHRAALDRGLITDGPDRTKRAVRDRIRRLPDGEIEWQKLQALAYGPRMREAQPVDGADAFLRRCRRAGIRVFIVSHKTEYAGYDDTRTNLRTAALEWMTAHRFFERDGLDLVPGDVYFESTRGAKIARIGSIGCSYFIDDLEEVFLEPSFPPQVQKILYAPDMALVCTHCATVMPTWQALGDYLFDRSPDLRGICRAALGRDVVSSAPIGAGRNSRVFRVELAGARPPSPLEVVVKFYRRDAGDARDRLGTEFGSLQFLWRNGVRAVPRPMAIDPDRQCAIYEYIAGEVATSGAIGAEDIDTSVGFLSALKRLRGAPGSEMLGAASEACFSLEAVVTSVERRLERLRRADPAGGDVGRLREWIAGTFEPFMAEVIEWYRRGAGRSGIAVDQVIPPEARTLSPSDFGFHNAIRRPDGTLAFVDFEYFGWDDPAKTIVDYLLHPSLGLGEPMKRRFAVRAQALFADVPMLADRARLVYPLFGLKWAMILLNDFLPERFSPGQGEWRETQLRKAQALIDRLAADYPINPYLR